MIGPPHIVDARAFVFERGLSAENIDQVTQEYLESIVEVSVHPKRQRGLALLSGRKRDAVGAGPYPNVTLCEAANRIMMDLVMLHGVRWLLTHDVFPFREYTAEYGHGNEGALDIEASEGGKALVGEVFNVSPSLFPLKKASAIRKLRASRSKADYRVILVNHDAVAASYVPKARPSEYYVFVNTETGEGRVIAGRH